MEIMHQSHLNEQHDVLAVKDLKQCIVPMERFLNSLLLLFGRTMYDISVLVIYAENLKQTSKEICTLNLKGNKVSSYRTNANKILIPRL